MKDFGSWDDLTDRQMGLSEEDDRNIVDLLVDQVEFADVIVINKTDLITPDELEQLEQLIRRLNPKAETLQVTESRVPLSAILGTGRFQLSEAEESPDWLAVPRGQEETETEEYGISSFVYRRDRPFHPQRLFEELNADLDEGLFAGVLRSKGLMWIATRHDYAYDWSQAGCSIRMDPAGSWWASTTDDEWPADPQEVAKIRAQFVGEFGDRHQELVFIGRELDQKRVESILDRCLLSDLEFAKGPGVWADFEDPLPPLELEPSRLHLLLASACIPNHRSKGVGHRVQGIKFQLELGGGWAAHGIGATLAMDRIHGNNGNKRSKKGGLEQIGNMPEHES